MRWKLLRLKLNVRGVSQLGMYGIWSEDINSMFKNMYSYFLVLITYCKLTVVTLFTVKYAVTTKR